MWYVITWTAITMFVLVQLGVFKKSHWKKK